MGKFVKPSFLQRGRRRRRAILHDDTNQRNTTMENGIVIKEPNAPAMSYEVALRTRSYKHKQYGRIETPDLPIVGWDGEPTAPPTAPPTQQLVGAAAGDLNDHIPF